MDFHAHSLTNNSTWATTAADASGQDGVEHLPFATRTAGYVCISGTARQNTSKGYSVNEFEVYSR